MTDETPPPKSAEEIEEFRDQIDALIISDAVKSGSKKWQKLEAAEVALDWVLGEAEGFQGLVDALDPEEDP